MTAAAAPAPRRLVSGPALSITGGHCDNNLLPFESHVQNAGVADGVEAVQHKTREIIKYGADLIKVCATGGVLSHGDNPQASQYTLEEMKAIVTDRTASDAKLQRMRTERRESAGRRWRAWIRSSTVHISMTRRLLR